MAKTNKPKFDYDSDEFYNEIQRLAFNGATDKQICYLLSEHFKVFTPMSPQTFSAMKNGIYQAWNKEQNKVRGQRIRDVLARARTKNNHLVKNTFLQVALGKIKTKNVSTVTRRLRVNGVMTDAEELQTTETEIEYAPNMQALATWLFHHDEEWRKVQRNLDEEASDVPQNISHGIDIAKWIDKEVEDDKKPS